MTIVNTVHVANFEKCKDILLMALSSNISVMLY